MPEHTPAPTPSRAVYGFTLVLFFKILFVIYLLWALIPERWFKLVGITCLPHHYWAVAIPIFLLTVLAGVGILYPFLGLIMTPTWNDIITIKDKFQENNKNELNINKTDHNSETCYCHNVHKCKKTIFDKYDLKEYNKKRVSQLKDLNIVNVSKHLYLKAN